MSKQQINLGLVGYGEIGSTLGRGLRASGLERITCFDLHAFDGSYADLIQGRAREAGVTLVRDRAALAEASDMILSVTPGSASIRSAEDFAPILSRRHIFVDVASATPKVKETVAARLASTGALIGDASILGSPRDGHALQMVASGPAAVPYRDALVPWGMNIEAVGGKIGAASGIKILRSVLMKGLEAVLVEMVLGARRYGLDEVVLASAAKSLSRPFPAIVNGLLTTDAIHAERRSEEAAMSADALEEVGLEPIMTRATAARLRWVAELGLKEHFNGVVPDDYRTAMAAIEEKLKAPA